VLNIHGFDLNRTLEMDPEFLNTEGEHLHDDTVTSVSMVHEAPVDMYALDDWVSMILRDKGEDIFRMKGVLSVHNSKQRFVYVSQLTLTTQHSALAAPKRDCASRASALGGWASCASLVL
jgi:G3E family GTPase